MKTRLLAILPFLVGCAHNPQVIETKVPVPVPCPEPALVVKPDLPIHNLTPADQKNFNKVGKAYVNSVILLESYSEALEEALKPYRKD